jgi:hypothetical protein
MRDLGLLEVFPYLAMGLSGQRLDTAQQNPGAPVQDPYPTGSLGHSPGTQPLDPRLSLQQGRGCLPQLVTEVHVLLAEALI